MSPPRIDKPRPISPRGAAFGRGKCQGCGLLVALTKRGIVRSHCGVGAGPRCDGFGLPPVEDLHRDAMAFVGGLGVEKL